MKKMLLLMILFMSGCNSVDYEVVKIDNQAYVINILDYNICCVNIEYEIKDEEDVFLLYTIYQNYLPIGYISPACSNISLIDCYSNDYYTFYEVDLYIDFVSDISLFKECITKTNRLYGFKDPIFLKNGYEVI